MNGIISMLSSDEIVAPVSKKDVITSATENRIIAIATGNNIITRASMSLSHVVILGLGTTHSLFT